MASKTRYLENVPFGSVEVRTTKTGEAYKAVYRAPVTSRRISKTFKGSTEAREWLKGIARDIARDMWIDPHLEKAEQEAAEAENALTVEAWLTQFHDEILPRRRNRKTGEATRVTTLQSYRRITRTRITEVDGEAGKLKDIPITKVTKADVVAWHNAIQTQFPDNATTNANAYKRLRAAFSEALERDLVPANPVLIREAGTAVAKEKELPTDGEIAAIVANFPERVKVGAVLCLYHGLRVGEMLALTREDVTIDREKGTAEVRINATLQRVVNTETGKTEMLRAAGPKTTAGRRTVPIFSMWVEEFIEHMDTRVEDSPTAPVITTKRGATMFDTSFRSTFDTARKKAGITRKITPHFGRNWLITRLAEAGATPAEIGRLLGQSDVQTIVGTYMKVNAERPTKIMGLVNDTVAPKGKGK